MRSLVVGIAMQRIALLSCIHATLLVACTTHQRSSIASKPGATASSAAGGSTSISSFGDCAVRPSPPKDLAQVPEETSPELTLYDLGSDPGSEPYDIHLSADGTLFWSQKGGGLYMAPKAGGASPAAIGGWRKSLLGIGIATDATQVYWLDDDKLRRKPRAGGTEEAISLPTNYDGGAIAVDQTYAYVALQGCGAITRIDKTSLVVNTMYIDGVSFTDGGPTALVIDGEDVVCGAWANVFVVSHWGQVPVHLVDSAQRIWSIAVTPDSIYWLDRPTDVHKGVRIGSVPRAGGAPSVRDTDASNGVGLHSAFDTKEATLWFDSGGWVASYSTRKQQLSLVVSDPLTGAGLVADETYLYWTSFRTHGAIKRMPFDCKPIVPDFQ
jgi:hypothetical protein